MKTGKEIIEESFVGCGFDPQAAELNVDKIHRLLNAAWRGGPAGSGGEQRARKIAKLMSKAIEECANTDLEVVEGAALLMCYAATGGDGYCLVRGILDRDGYRRGAR